LCINSNFNNRCCCNMETLHSPTPTLRLPLKKNGFPYPINLHCCTSFCEYERRPKQEYFSDGITEEIITALLKFLVCLSLLATPRSPIKEVVKVKQVSEELGVRYVLEGSVRRSGEKVRITAQLIDALKGHHLWAERYDRILKHLCPTG